MLSENQLIINRYRLISLKGRGSFGEVWKAHDEQTDLDVAVKVYIALDDRGIEEFREEYRNSYSFNHPNLLHAYHFDVVDRQPILVMPYCPDSAMSIIGVADEKTVWRFIRDVASGLEYLHGRNVIHRDIKPDNVLIGQDGSFLITDFGVSSKMKSTLRRNSTRVMAAEDVSGTIGYMAPELFSRNPEAVKATDVWALGASLFEILTGEMPFFGQGGVMQMSGAQIPEIRGDWSPELKRVVESCLSKETWDRPTAAQLVEIANGVLTGANASEPGSAKKQTPVMDVVPEKNEVGRKSKTRVFLKSLIALTIILGVGLLVKIARSSGMREPTDTPVAKETSTQIALPSGTNIYHGVAYLDGGNSVKIKRVELNFETKQGKSYYSDAPLDLVITEITPGGSVVNLKIQETSPKLARSQLGDKVSSIYDGVYDKDGSIMGRGKNWKGQEFKFIFTPGEEPTEKLSSAQESAATAKPADDKSSAAVDKTSPKTSNEGRRENSSSNEAKVKESTSTKMTLSKTSIELKVSIR